MAWTNPQHRKAWDHVCQQFKAQEAPARVNALGKFTTLTLTSSDDVGDYINTLFRYRQNLLDAKAEYTDDQMMIRIINALQSSPDFASFVDTYDFTLAILDNLTAQLRRHELNQRSFSRRGSLAGWTRRHYHRREDRPNKLINMERGSDPDLKVALQGEFTLDMRVARVKPLTKGACDRSGSVDHYEVIVVR